MKLMRPEEVTPSTVLKYDCTPEELAEVYRLARESFTASDLQKYTEPTDDFVSAQDVLREMEEYLRQSKAKRNQS